MKNTKTKTAASVTTKVAAKSLTYVSGKSRAEHNIKRARLLTVCPLKKL